MSRSSARIRANARVGPCAKVGRQRRGSRSRSSAAGTISLISPQSSASLGGDRRVLQIGLRGPARGPIRRGRCQVPPPSPERPRAAKAVTNLVSFGGEHEVGGVHVAEPAAGDRPVGGGDDRARRCGSVHERPRGTVSSCARTARRTLRAAILQEVADVAADGERGPVAADEDGPHGWVGGDPAGDDQRLLAPSAGRWRCAASGRFRQMVATPSVTE